MKLTSGGRFLALGNLLPQLNKLTLLSERPGVMNVMSGIRRERRSL